MICTHHTRSEVIVLAMLAIIRAYDSDGAWLCLFCVLRSCLVFSVSSRLLFIVLL